MVNFGIAYGLSAFGLADRLQISREEAAVYIQRYFERFPAVKRFIDETIASAERDGFVTTLMGRRRAIPELRSDQRQRRSLGERLAVNTVIQGTAADIIKLAMVRCHAALAEAGMESRLVLQIHDELLFEGPDGGDGARHRARPRARCAPPSTSTRRWRSTSASAGTGWRQSRGRRSPRASYPSAPTGITMTASPCLLTAAVGGLIALQPRDQRRPRPRDRQPSGRPGLVCRRGPCFSP